MFRSPSISRLLKWLSVGIVSFWLVVGVALLPALPQSPVTTISTPVQGGVVLDGQLLFQLSDSDQYSAADRANLINLQLRESMESAESPQLKVELRNQLPTILLNNRYLLTVTSRDALPGTSPKDQAALWADQLQKALQQAQLERSSNYIQLALLQAAGLVFAGLMLNLLLGWLCQRLLAFLRRQFATADTDTVAAQALRPLEQFVHVMLAILRVIAWVVIGLYITNLFPLTRNWSYKITSGLFSSLTSPMLTLGKSSYSLTDLFILATLLIGLIFFAEITTNLLRSRVLSLSGINQGGQDVISTVAKYGLITIGTLVLLQVWGLDISSLTIVASALGVGIGLGFQNIAKNFGSGLILVLERPIQVGDFVEVSDSMGTIERIGPRSTVIRTLDHVSIIVPNSRFLEEEVINWSHGNPLSRLHLPVGVTYNADPKAVEAALLEAAQGYSGILSHPPCQVFFKGFGDSALNFELLVWTAKPHLQAVLSSDLYFRIFRALQEHQIEIPYPQHDLHLRSGTLNLSPQSAQLLTSQAERESKSSSL